jgi:hypothetical protein
MKKKCNHKIDEEQEQLKRMRLPKKLVEHALRLHELGLCGIEPSEEKVAVTVSATLGRAIPKGYKCSQCHTKGGFNHKMSCDTPRKLVKLGNPNKRP